MTGDESNLNFTTEPGGVYASSFRVRCPDCYKSYAVEWTEVHIALPRFECVACHTRFKIEVSKAIGAMSDIMGIKESEDTTDGLTELYHSENSNLQISRLENKNSKLEDRVNLTPATVSHEVFNCPKCQAPFSATDKECASCGIIFLKWAEKNQSRLSERREENISASTELKALWEEVLYDFENEMTHQKFINSAWSDDNLEYASCKYAGILDVVPNDEWALKGKKRIIDLTQVRFEVLNQNKDAGVKKTLNFLNVLDVVQTSLRKMRITNLIMFCCVILIFIGVFTPGLRNMIGFGTSVLFFILALRFYFRVI